MELTKNISNSTKLNFYINLLNFIPFVMAITSGLILQIEYHMLKLPDDYIVSGLNRAGLLLLHKITSTISLMGIMVHCLLHRKFISNKSKSIIQNKSLSQIPLSYWLLTISITISLIALISWTFFDHGNPAKHFFIEVHDKLALIFIVLSVIHIVSHTGWMMRIGSILFPTQERNRKNETEYISFNSKKCNACWKCLKVCPQKVLGKINLILHKHAQIVNSSNCTGCQKCVNVCRFRAIISLTDKSLS